MVRDTQLRRRGVPRQRRELVDHHDHRRSVVLNDDNRRARVCLSRSECVACDLAGTVPLRTQRAGVVPDALLLHDDTPTDVLDLDDLDLDLDFDFKFQFSTPDDDGSPDDVLDVAAADEFNLDHATTMHANRMPIELLRGVQRSRSRDRNLAMDVGPLRVW